MKEEDIFKEIINEEKVDNSELLFKQYKLFVEMADHISERREKTNKLYITLMTALFGMVAVFAKLTYPCIICLVPFLILIRYFSVNWANHIETYKTLNSAKFKVINHLENFLPVKGYTQEWKFCKLRGYNKLTEKDKANPHIIKKISEICAVLVVIIQIIIIVF
ncbi:MAG: hypothetical protein MJ203_05185 [archaeon]|nr:hypothetical protein [archaeon]